MSVPLAQSSSPVPVQEIYCVCSGLNAHCVIGIPDKVQTESECIESEEGQWKKSGDGGRRRRK